MEHSPESIHKSLAEDPSKVFVQSKEGHLLTLEGWMKAIHGIWQVHVYPGSFNPLHDGHRAIFENLPKGDVARLFEMSLNRWDKPMVSVEELKTRLKQFVGYAPVMVTNVAKFVEKAGLLRNAPIVYFHVGADTLSRILEHSSIHEVEGYKCQFVVYDRIMNGARVVITEKLPGNCQRGGALPEDKMTLSSTSIRNKALDKTTEKS